MSEVTYLHRSPNVVLSFVSKAPTKLDSSAVKDNLDEVKDRTLCQSRNKQMITILIKAIEIKVINTLSVALCSLFSLQEELEGNV